MNLELQVLQLAKDCLKELESFKDSKINLPYQMDLEVLFQQDLNKIMEDSSSKENEEIRESCTIDIPVTGKPNMYRPKLKSSLYIQRMIAASVVMPDQFDSELQDSYGVKTPEDLLMAMVDDPGEYNDLAAFVQKFHGFNVSFEDKVNEAKN